MWQNGWWPTNPNRLFPRGYWDELFITRTTGKINPKFYIDHNEQIYNYKDYYNAYINDDVRYQLKEVTFFNDGIINPGIKALLQAVEASKAAGELTTCKILPNPEVYWYAIKSDRFITVKATDGVVQLEINNKFIRHLYNTTCKGEKGAVGPVGKNGVDGLPGPSEKTIIPIPTGKSLAINSVVETPLETPISLRIYNLQLEVILEIRVQMDGTWTSASDFEIVLDDTSTIVFDRAEKSLKATLVTTTSWEQGLTARVRQTGPKGRDGDEGSGFLTIEESTLTGVKSLTAVTALMNLGQDVHFGRKRYGDAFYVTHLRPNGLSFVDPIEQIRPKGSDIPDLWAAVSPTTGKSKDIFRWSLQKDDTEKPELDLPHWTPLKVCGYGGWSGFDKAEDIPCCQEDLFICEQDPYVCPEY